MYQLGRRTPVHQTHFPTPISGEARLPGGVEPKIIIREVIITPTPGAIYIDGPTYGSIDRYETGYMDPEISTPENIDIERLNESYENLPDKIRPKTIPTIYYYQRELTSLKKNPVDLSLEDRTVIRWEVDSNNPEHYIDVSFRGNDVFILETVDEESLGEPLSAQKQSLQAQVARHYVTRYVLENHAIIDDWVRRFPWKIVNRPYGYEWITIGPQLTPAQSPYVLR